MRILFFHMFNLDSGWGGSASMMKALHGALTRLGHSVQVVSARRPDRFGMTVCEFPFRVELTFGPEKRAGEATIDEIQALPSWRRLRPAAPTRSRRSCSPAGCPI